MNLIDSFRDDLKAKFPQGAYDFKYENGNNVVDLPKEDLVAVLGHLKSSGQFDLLMNLTGLDYPDRDKRFEVCYELFSSKDCKRLRLRCQVGENESIDTATTVFKGANWFEREAYDMVGIRFEEHC